MSCEHHRCAVVAVDKGEGTDGSAKEIPGGAVNCVDEKGKSRLPLELRLKEQLTSKRETDRAFPIGAVAVGAKGWPLKPDPIQNQEL